MRFAKLTYRIAGIWGLLITVPMYFLYNEIGRDDPPPLSHPHFYFGWVGVTSAWQILFLFLATDPARFRPLMIPAMIEKLSYVAAVAVLFGLKLINLQEAATAFPDAILLVFFVLAFLKTPGRVSEFV